jgi:putative ABC transport system permease protein
MLADLLSDLRYRLRAVFSRDAVERELDDELRFHIEREAEKYVAAGMTPDAALRMARIGFGGVDQVKDDARDARGITWLEILVQDTRYAVRGLRARPGFTAAVVVTLGLGIGANAAMFGIIDRAMLRPPAFLRDPGSVARLYLTSTFRGEEILSRSSEYRTYLDIKSASSTWSQIAAFQNRELPVGFGTETSEMMVGVASAAYFDFFDARPVLGRFYSAADDSLPAGQPVAVLSYKYWQTQFGGRLDALGAKLKIDQGVFTVIGVAPEGFVGISDRKDPAMWVPITAYAYSFRPKYYLSYDWGWHEIVVRRKPGVTARRLTADLTNAFRQSWLVQRSLEPSIAPVEIARPHVVVGPAQLARGPQAGRTGSVLTWVGGVAVIVLLIACANVANLMLARAIQRRREVGVRLALGVSRGRLFAQMLTESVVLAVLSGGIGLVVARVVSATLRTIFSIEGAPDSVLDGRMVAFAAGTTLFVGILTGLAPAVHGLRSSLLTSLKSSARDGAHQRSLMRSTLVVVQGALSVMLLVGAGLFVRSLSNVRNMRLGYDADRVLWVGRVMRDLKITDGESVALNRRLLAQALALPEVENASEAETIPFYNHESRGLFVDGIDSVRKLGRFNLQLAGPTYFKTAGTRILAGRAFTTEDRRGAPLVAVVSQEMAKRLWPGTSALGKCFRMNADTTPCITVVGIAENIKERALSHDAEAHYYLPADQSSRPAWGLYVRARGRATDHSEAIRASLQRLMPGGSYVTIAPLEQLIGEQQRSWSFGATMFLAFGALALVLAMVGLYSVIAYNVVQRTHELGVRIALGAQMRDVLRLVMGQGVRLGLSGLAIGGTIAWWAGRFLEPLMFDVSPRDPVVFGVVTAVLIGVALLASVLPASRAARVDPNTALRAE